MPQITYTKAVLRYVHIVVSSGFIFIHDKRTICKAGTEVSLKKKKIVLVCINAKLFRLAFCGKIESAGSPVPCFDNLSTSFWFVSWFQFHCKSLIKLSRKRWMSLSYTVNVSPTILNLHMQKTVYFSNLLWFL